jgi:hypothetical protein
MEPPKKSESVTASGKRQASRDKQRTGARIEERYKVVNMKE